MINELAGRLGRGKYFSADPRTVFEELRSASQGGVADYSGITYERIDAEDGVFWPCPSGTVGTPRLFTERFGTPDGRAVFKRVDHREPAEQPDRDFPYVLTTGRVMQQYQSGAQTRRVKQLNLQQPHAFAEIHPDLARRHGIADSDMVELRTRRGKGVFRAKVTDVVRPDVIFVPFHWGGRSNVNAMTNPVLDRFSKMPAFKVCSVTLSLVEGETP